MTLRIAGQYLFASLSDIPTGKKHRILKAPSSSSGRNSVPTFRMPISTYNNHNSERHEHRPERVTIHEGYRLLVLALDPSIDGIVPFKLAGVF